jgi:hypothetical protein
MKVTVGAAVDPKPAIDIPRLPFPYNEAPLVW